MEKCRWCGNIHGLICPSVKAIEFQADGFTVKRVEFMTPVDYPNQFVGAISAPGYPTKAADAYLGEAN